MGPAVALLLDGGLSLGLIYGGWWLHRTELDTAEKWTVAKWTVAGAGAGATIAVLTLAVQAIEGRPLAEPEFRVLVAAAGGAVVLFIAGYYAARAEALSRRYESILNNTFQFTGLLRPDRTLVEVNQAALEFSDSEREELVGRQFDTISWWTHSEAVREKVKEALEQAAGGEAVRYETEAQGIDGLRRIDFSAKPIVAADETVTGIVVEGRDITEQERQRQHLQVIQRVIRHNMRNDITKLRGFTQQLTATGEAAADEEYVNKVYETLDTWESMTSKITDIQQAIDTETQAYATASIDELLVDIAEQKEAANPQTEITVTSPEESANPVPSVVVEAFEEIIENAIAASKEKPPEIAVDVSCDREWTTVTISDNGPGLPSTEAAVLETGEETQLVHGQGLGVWKVRMLIKQAGGTITVNTSDAGTTIDVRLPVAPSVIRPN